MNGSIVRYIVGGVLKIEAAFLLLPMIVALIYREQGWYYFLITAVIGAVVGTLLTIVKPKNDVFYLKEGCAATGLSWIVMGLLGCLPFWMSQEIPSFVDALFETISGFTTTGASILPDVEALSQGMLFWRSFTHWLGGMGVLVFLLAVIPMSGGSNINLMRAESPGPSVGKLVPKMRTTARMLYLIYMGLTILEFLILVIGRMPVFDAITTALGTAGTGGFGIKGDSIASYAPHLQVIITVFMILFGVNFNAYYFIVMGKFKEMFKMEEVRIYFGIIIAATLVIFFNIVKTTESVGEALNQASFQVASIITTTGFATADFDQWNALCKTILFLLMFCGACAGSTGGGIKVSRFILINKTVKKEIASYIHPRSVKKIQMDGKPVEHDVIRSVNVYFATFMALYFISVILVTLEGYDLVTVLSSVAATINNIGPGLNLVGPTCNFAFFNDFTKIVLIFDMLAGRLELFPMLILFHPALWQGRVRQRHVSRVINKRNKGAL